MSSTLILMAIFVIAAAAVVGGWYLLRVRKLRHRFGPEYERLASETNHAKAARDLRERMRRHADLNLTELSPEQRDRYVGRWRALQIHFVDAPGEAVREADVLTSTLVAEIGYPVENYDEQLAQLSVDHAEPVPKLREAHEVSRRLIEGGEATTEQLRRAMVAYRAMVIELLGSDAHVDEPTEGSRSHAV